MKLSRREKDVLTLVACGLADKQIAKKFKISIRTVQKHVYSAMLKLKASSRVHAVVLYMHHNPKWKINKRNISL